MTTKLNQCDTKEKFSAYITETPVYVSEKGGRRFQFGDESVSEKAIIKQFEKIIQVDKELTDTEVKDILARIKTLSEEATADLKFTEFVHCDLALVLLKLKTFFKQLIGNLGYSKEAHLKKIENGTYVASANPAPTETPDQESASLEDSTKAISSEADMSEDKSLIVEDSQESIESSETSRRFRYLIEALNSETTDSSAETNEETDSTVSNDSDNFTPSSLDEESETIDSADIITGKIVKAISSIEDDQILSFLDKYLSNDFEYILGDEILKAFSVKFEHLSDTDLQAVFKSYPEFYTILVAFNEELNKGLYLKLLENVPNDDDLITFLDPDDELRVNNANTAKALISQINTATNEQLFAILGGSVTVEMKANINTLLRHVSEDLTSRIKLIHNKINPVSVEVLIERFNKDLLELQETHASMIESAYELNKKIFMALAKRICWGDFYKHKELYNAHPEAYKSLLLNIYASNSATFSTDNSVKEMVTAMNDADLFKQALMECMEL